MNVFAGLLWAYFGIGGCLAAVVAAAVGHLRRRHTDDPDARAAVRQVEDVVNQHGPVLIFVVLVVLWPYAVARVWRDK